MRYVPVSLSFPACSSLRRSLSDSAIRPYCHSITSAFLFYTLSPRHISLTTLYLFSLHLLSSTFFLFLMHPSTLSSLLLTPYSSRSRTGYPACTRRERMKKNEREAAMESLATHPRLILLFSWKSSLLWIFSRGSRLPANATGLSSILRPGHLFRFETIVKYMGLDRSEYSIGDFYYTVDCWFDFVEEGQTIYFIILLRILLRIYRVWYQRYCEENFCQNGNRDIVKFVC